MGKQLRNHRMLVLAAVLAAALSVALTACSSDDGENSSGTVEVGPGSSDRAPAARRLSRTTATEPAWSAEIPDVATPQASDDDRRLVEGLAGSVGARPADASAFARARGRGDSADYEGTTDIEIAYYNYCQTRDGNLGYAGRGEYELDAEVYVNPRAEESGVNERSPFNLIIGTENGVEGTLSAVSATVVTDTRDGRSALLDYWDIDRRGDRISGVLTDRWPGYILNTISTAQLIVPCQPDLVFVMPDSIAAGAKLTGTIDADEADLVLLGQSYDREVRFRATISAERTD